MQLMHAKATVDELSSRISVMEVNRENVSTSGLIVSNYSLCRSFWISTYIGFAMHLDITL
jgi:hypothetical protein